MGKAPRGAVAYKFTPEEATTTLLHVRVQVGRTGVLTPVATLVPVSVGGITITHATLHNFDEIHRLGIKIGDTVLVTRSGDVIPKITKVFQNLRSGKEKDVSIPSTCPVDGSHIIRDGVYYKCGNANCGARLERALRYFVSRGAFNIEGLGRKIIDRFLDEGLIADAADIFTLKKDDIAILPRFGLQSAENIVREVNAKKEIHLSRFLYALGIDHIGEENAELLGEFIVRMKKGKALSVTGVGHILERAKKEELLDIEAIGPKIAESVDVWFKDARNKNLLKKLERVGIRIAHSSIRVKRGALSGCTFVLTGTLGTLSRPQAKEKIKERGGRVASSVSKKTDYVIAGENPGSKLKEAEMLGVRIINEKEFLKMLKSLPRQR